MRQKQRWPKHTQSNPLIFRLRQNVGSVVACCGHACALLASTRAAIASFFSFRQRLESSTQKKTMTQWDSSQCPFVIHSKGLHSRDRLLPRSSACQAKPTHQAKWRSIISTSLTSTSLQSSPSSFLPNSDGSTQTVLANWYDNLWWKHSRRKPCSEQAPTPCKEYPVSHGIMPAACATRSASVLMQACSGQTQTIIYPS